MKKFLVSYFMLFPALSFMFAQTTSQQSRSSVCTFDDGRQMSVRYTAVPIRSLKLSDGRVWPGGELPIYLFTSAPLRVGTESIPAGAYSLYVVPGKQEWTLVLNKNVSNSQYDEKQDLLRTTMDIGRVTNPETNISLDFGHLGPKQCNLRLYFGKTGAWVEFREQEGRESASR
jgi:hypothetical protein